MNTNLSGKLEKKTFLWVNGVTGLVLVESTKAVVKTWAIHWKCGWKPDSRRKLRHLDFILVVMKR